MTSLIGAPRALVAESEQPQSGVVIFAPTAVEAISLGARPLRLSTAPAMGSQFREVVGPRSMITVIAFALLVFTVGRLAIHEPIDVISPAERQIAAETSRLRTLHQTATDAHPVEANAIPTAPSQSSTRPEPQRKPPAAIAPQVAAPPVTTAPAPPPTEAPHRVLSGPHGTDISWPQCHAPAPAPQNFAIIGVTNGRPMSGNPCLARQWEWAMSQGAASVYINLAFPDSGSVPLECDPGCAHQFGTDTFNQAMAYAKSQGVDSPMVWLDVENGSTGNPWSSNLGLNAALIQGAIDAAQQANLLVGVYSTPKMWSGIAGTYRPGVPVWYPIGPSDGSNAPFKCGPGFTGGPVWLVQYLWENLDRNIACADVVLSSDAVPHAAVEQTAEVPGLTPSR